MAGFGLSKPSTYGRTRRVLGPLAVLLALGAFFVIGAKTRPTPAQRVKPPASNPADYVGGEECAACHTEVAEAFQKNPHYKTWSNATLDWSQRGCEACHGPGRAHIEDLDVSKILNFKKISAQRVSDECLNCHLQQQEHVNFLRNEHGLNAVACTECHSIHSPGVRSPLLTANQPALCFDCHAEVRPQFNKPFRHKVHEGLVKCTDCHNQHGGYNLRQMQASTGNDAACFQCHADKQGPFVFEHAPVRVDGCAICHDPHGSSNPRLLKRSEIRFLCLDCHAGTPGVPGPTPPGWHNQTALTYQNCISCHVEIHGSNLSHLFFE